VTLASDSAIAPARLSRFVQRTVRCPPSTDAPRFLEWLRSFALREPGHVYYPTSDSAAWLVAEHRDTLQPGLKLYTPGIDALVALLDKIRMAQAAREAGLDAPESWLPGDEADVARLAREAPFPVVVKPRLNALNPGGARAVRVDHPGNLVRAWRQVRAGCRLSPDVAARVEGGELPMVQALLPGSERIYTIDGFVDGTGALAAGLACTKILQRPRGRGPGIAFEEAPLHPRQWAGLRRMLLAVGFQGVFDAEFIADGDRLLLIDVNPRFYNHMAFEVDRGLPLAWLAYLAASGDHQRLAQAIGDAGTPRARGTRVFLHRDHFRLMLRLQTLSGGMSIGEAREWRAWASGASAITDPASAPGDRRPRVLDLALLLKQCFAHPRAFVQSMAGGMLAHAREGAVSGNDVRAASSTRP
jgi:predicted ATP-grasp superfamily ATP-dependent carboligase